MKSSPQAADWQEAADGWWDSPAPSALLILKRQRLREQKSKSESRKGGELE